MAYTSFLFLDCEIISISFILEALNNINVIYFGVQNLY